MATSFREEVARFREWASPHEGSYGEWECDYEHWDALWSATEEMMAECAADLPDEGTSDDLLYAIARDNEIERLRRELVKYPVLLRHLALYAVDSPDADAKWQIAVSVADAQLADSADLMRSYLTDEDEYVRRRSLLAIAPLSPKEAEEIAKRWMDEEFEYSRIAGIHVLDLVNSESLGSYLSKHASDPNQYVRSNVDEIRRRRQKAQQDQST